MGSTGGHGHLPLRTYAPLPSPAGMGHREYCPNRRATSAQLVIHTVDLERYATKSVIVPLQVVGHSVI